MSGNPFLKPLNEITDEEVSHIESVLNGLSPEHLSFNDLFQGRMRIIEPISVPEENIDKLKQWAKNNYYNLDFNTGLVSWQVLKDDPKHVLSPKEVSNLPDDKSQNLITKQMRLGKLLQKLLRIKTKMDILHDEMEAIFQLIFGHASEKTEEQQKKKDQWDKYNVMRGEIESGTFGDHQKLETDEIKNLIEFWNKKSTYYRENPKLAEEGEAGRYSIIYTRHPIDVLRMSDFEDIQSCHSPSRGGEPAEYYKCAVGEAHGHGFVAYVVENESLENIKQTWDVKKLSNEELIDHMEEQELFSDPERLEAGIEPVSRLRYRKFVHQNGTELAVPEMSTYGERKIPGLNKVGLEWAQNNQAEKIAQIAAQDNIDLSQFTLYGGSYEDTIPGHLFANLFNIDLNRWKEKIHGQVGTEHSEQWEFEQQQGIASTERYQQEADEIVERFNQRYQYAKLSAEAAADDGTAYIMTSGSGMIIPIDESEWEKYPNYRDETLDYITDELEQYGFEWFDSVFFRQDRHDPRIELGFNMVKIDETYAGLLPSPHELEDLANRIDEIDDQGDTINEIIKQFLKREGYLKLSPFEEIVNKYPNPSFWEVEASHDWDGELESVTVEGDLYLELGDSILQYKEKVDKVLSSDEFKTETRTEIINAAAAASKFEGEFHYPIMEFSVGEIDDDGDSRIQIVFVIRPGYDSEGQAKAVKDVLEYLDDEEEVQTLVAKAFSKFQEQILVEGKIDDLYSVIGNQNTIYDRWWSDFS